MDFCLGSFHVSLISYKDCLGYRSSDQKGWKLLPIIGQYVVEMLKGELTEEMGRRWEWDRSFENKLRNALLPERERRDLED